MFEQIICGKILSMHIELVGMQLALSQIELILLQ